MRPTETNPKSFNRLLTVLVVLGLALSVGWARRQGSGPGAHSSLGSAGPGDANAAQRLEVQLELSAQGGGPVSEVLKRWSDADLRALEGTPLPAGQVLKLVRRTEAVSLLGRGTRNLSVQGVVLSQLIDAALLATAVERRAEVDSVVLESADGRQTQIPRSFLVRYPVLLAISGVPADWGDWLTVPPYSSHGAKMAQEELPVLRFALARVRKITLTNYRSRFGGYLLSRRRDPAALRGEKLVVQNCFVCHGVGSGPPPEAIISPTEGVIAGGSEGPQGASASSRSRTLALLTTPLGQVPSPDTVGGIRHPQVEGLPRFTERDERALKSYLATRALGRATPRSP